MLSLNSVLKASFSIFITLVGSSFNLPLISLPEGFEPIIYALNAVSEFTISPSDFKYLS